MEDAPDVAAEAAAGIGRELILYDFDLSMTAARKDDVLNCLLDRGVLDSAAVVPLYEEDEQEPVRIPSSMLAELMTELRGCLVRDTKPYGTCGCSGTFSIELSGGSCGTTRLDVAPSWYPSTTLSGCQIHLSGGRGETFGGCPDLATFLDHFAQPFAPGSSRRQR